VDVNLHHRALALQHTTLAEYWRLGWYAAEIREILAALAIR
jgi:hypothetical protein